MTSPAAFAQATYQLPSDAFSDPALVNPGQEPGQIDAESALSDSDLPRQGTPRLMSALKELAGARPGYLEAEKMYDGNIGDIQLNPVVAKLLAQAGVNEIEDLNYAKVPVDTIAGELTIRAVQVAPEDMRPGQQLTDEQKAAVAEAQKVLDRIRKDNQLDIEEVELLDRASRYGDAYLEVWPAGVAPDGPADGGVDHDYGDEDELEQGRFEQPDDGEEHPGVDIYVVSPLNVRVFYDSEQPLHPTHAIKQWEWCSLEDPETGSRQRATLYIGAEYIERWILDEDGDPGKAEDWKPFLEGDEEWPMPYPDGVDRLPFFHHRNKRPYGEPEHKPAYGPQKLINKLVSSHGVSIDFQAFPQRYALLDPKADSALMNLINPDNPEDEGDDPEGDGHSQLRADPSAVWRMYANTVGQFAAADPDVFLTPLDRYIKSIAELCGIPLDRFVGYTTPPSGQSRRIGNEVLYKKVNRRRKRHAGTLQDAYEFALRLAGLTGHQVVVKWEPLDVASGPEDWAMVGNKIANGVPVRNALVEAGYPEDEVEQWLLDQTGADLVRRVALLNSISTAVQALAAGVGVGLVSREQAADLVARVLGEVAQDLPDLDNPVSIQPPPIPPAMPPPGQQQRGDGEGGQSAPAMPQMPPMPPPIQVGVGAPGAPGAAPPQE